MLLRLLVRRERLPREHLEARLRVICPIALSFLTFRRILSGPRPWAPDARYRF